MPGRQYAYVGGRISGVRTTFISVELYFALPKGTALQGSEGTRYYKGEGRLREAPDYRYYGQDRITDVGFPSREDDPIGLFKDDYRDR